MRLLILACIVVFSAFSVCPCETQAAGKSSFICSVELAGPTSSGTQIVLRNLSEKMNTMAYSWPLGSSKTFAAPAALAKEYLATALTAMANGRNVNIRLSPAAAGKVTITHFLLTTEEVE
ncbi:MAG: hypothetical protein AAGU11_01430 [Syntrophobacteraceae bacterium]